MPAAVGTLSIKVIPDAPRTEIAGRLGDALKVKIHAPALEGRANDELRAFLAEKLGIPKRAITLLQGEKSRQNIVLIDGLDTPAIQQRLLPK